MQCLVANCAVVSSPRSASSATFALNSAEYRVRLPVIRVRPSRRRTELTRLPEIRGPPQVQALRLSLARTAGAAGASPDASGRRRYRAPGVGADRTANG